MLKIQQVSKWMVILLTGAFIIMILAAAALAVFPDISIRQIYSSYNLSPNLPPLSAWQYGALAVLAVLNFLPTLYVIWNLRKMFRRFAMGEIFTAPATKHLFEAAKGMVAGGVIAILSTTIGALILTANAPAGEHAFAVAVSSAQLAGILAGVIFVVMGWVMQEAARLSDENAGFV